MARVVQCSHVRAALQVVLAADVLYDDAMTDNFCDFLLRFLSAATASASPPSLLQPTGPLHTDPAPLPTAGSDTACSATVWPEGCIRGHGRPLVLLAAEKRRVFTTAACAVRAPAFEYFLHALAAPERQLCGRRLAVQPLSVAAVPQAFAYRRGDDLVLLQVVLQPAAAEGSSVMAE